MARAQITLLLLAMLLSEALSAAVQGINFGRGGVTRPTVAANAPFVSTPVSGDVSGAVFDAEGNPLGNVAVVFWKQSGARSGNRVTVVTDQMGVYRLALSDGIWLGSACGSQQGYQPQGWQLEIHDGVMISFVELFNRKTQIGAGLSVANLLDGGERIRLTGSGFGCSGRLVIELADGRQLSVEQFSKHADGDIEFIFPDPNVSIPGPLTEVSRIIKTGALFFEQAGQRSNAVVFRYHLWQKKTFSKTRTGQLEGLSKEPVKNVKSTGKKQLKLPAGSKSNK